MHNNSVLPNTGKWNSKVKIRQKKKRKKGKQKRVNVERNKVLTEKSPNSLTIAWAYSPPEAVDELSNEQPTPIIVCRESEYVNKMGMKYRLTSHYSLKQWMTY